MYLPKRDILAVHPRGWVEGDVKLRVVRVATMIGHPQNTRTGVRDGEALVCYGKRHTYQGRHITDDHPHI